jgi:hypothetical protein
MQAGHELRPNASAVPAKHEVLDAPSLACDGCSWPPAVPESPAVVVPRQRELADHDYAEIRHASSVAHPQGSHSAIRVGDVHHAFGRPQ